MKFMLLVLNKKITKFNEVLVYVSVMNKKLQNYARKEENELYALNQCIVVALWEKQSSLTLSKNIFFITN